MEIPDEYRNGIVALWEPVGYHGDYVVYRVERECGQCRHRWKRTERVHCSRIDQHCTEADNREADVHAEFCDPDD